MPSRRLSRLIEGSQQLLAIFKNRFNPPPPAPGLEEIDEEEGEEDAAPAAEEVEPSQLQRLSSTVSVYMAAVAVSRPIKVAMYVREVAASFMFVADIGLDIYLIRQFFQGGNVWWCSLTTSFVIAQYMVSAIAVAQFVRTGLTALSGNEGVCIPSLAVGLGPIGIFGLDVALAIRSLNYGTLLLDKALYCTANCTRL